MSAVAYPVALGAAATFAIAIPLEHRAADSVPDAGGLGPRKVGAFVRVTVRNRWWLTGMGLNTLGLGLHAVALVFLAMLALAAVNPSRHERLPAAMPAPRPSR